MNKHPPNPHSKFFSSLNHLHKRLKLDSTTTTTTTLPPPPPPPPSSQSPLPSPLFLHHPNTPSTTHSTPTPPPLEFLSTPTSQNTTHSIHTDDYIDVDVDEMGLLVGLLGLSDSDDGLDYLSECSCRCDGGFYDKVVGVKGPKCGKEVARLDGWIRCFIKERIEPFRLVHLMLGKASFCDSLGGVEFPSTVDGFLLLDPPFGPKDV